jgi:5-methylcytosine-specific restriction endonuclease McrA
VKRCCGCGERFPVKEFGSRPDKTSRCRSCLREYKRQYRATHREVTRTAWRAWAARNRERVNAGNRRWREDHPEEMRAFRESWRSRHPEYHTDKESRRRARKRDAGYERIDRRAIFERDGGLCGICGESADPQSFHLDHIIPIAAGGPHYEWNVRVAHPRCNQSKGARVDPVLFRITILKPKRGKRVA